MAKMKKLERLGKQEINKLEVAESTADSIPSSFVTEDGTIHHNCNGPHK